MKQRKNKRSRGKLETYFAAHECEILAFLAVVTLFFERENGFDPYLRVLKLIADI